MCEGQLLEEVLQRDELDNFGSLRILPLGIIGLQHRQL